MGIFDFLKKIFETDNVEEIVIEKLDFFEIESWIERKIRENEIKEKEILSVVKKKIEVFIKEFREKIVILENFDIKAKKEKDHLKNIVAESREKYIESVEDLIERLSDLKELKLEKFIEKINKIFFDFNKSSFKNYERATILIGKEMANIKESLKVFSKDLLKTFEESKSIIDFFRNILIIKEKLNTITLIDKTLERISEKKLNLNKEISEKEKENRILKENLEEVKTSNVYLENLAKQDKIKFLREELKKDIFEFRQLLDFKALASFFRINPEQMRMVKDHRENFQLNFEKDNGKVIIELLDEAKLSNDIIFKKIKQIRAKVEETENNKKNLKEDESQKVYLKIKEVIIEIDNLKIEKVKEEKRDEKLKTSKEELISILKQKLAKLNVEVV
ncbi:hypothetical protein CMI40_00570 [Candidatus Pacearchaeota archaeon]|jgi:hypothetical protein|nr:hypothetical protein [Candidatus Pacearchaeota archaeon]|tara:strand:- start:2731 stop:3906 length:1176 start_codon:yes stop_codon:yes gene_type:complete